MKIYCGSNKHVPRGSKKGSPYECMKQGYGVCKGKGLEGTGGNARYELDREAGFKKIYCGTKRVDRSQYDRVGNRSECFRKGFGACKYKG